MYHSSSEHCVFFKVTLLPIISLCFFFFFSSFNYLFIVLVFSPVFHCYCYLISRSKSLLHMNELLRQHEITRIPDFLKPKSRFILVHAFFDVFYAFWNLDLFLLKKLHFTKMNLNVSYDKNKRRSPQHKNKEVWLLLQILAFFVYEILNLK